MDSLEQFIVQGREDFDTDVPDLKVWGEIDAQLEQQGTSGRVRKLRQVWRVAAAVALLITAGVFFFLRQPMATNGGTISTNSIAAIAPEYAEMEQYYHRQVTEKTQQLVAVQHYDAVHADLAQLDATMAELQEELKHAPKGAEEQIVNAMLANYQAKVRILERVLEKVEMVPAINSKEEKYEISI